MSEEDKPEVPEEGFDLEKVSENLKPVDILKTHINRCLALEAMQDVYGYQSAVDGLESIIRPLAVNNERYTQTLKTLRADYLIFNRKDVKSPTRKQKESFLFQNTKRRFDNCMDLIQERGLWFSEVDDETVKEEVKT